MAEGIRVIGLDEVQLLLRQLPIHSFVTTKNAISQTVVETHKVISSYRNGLINRTGNLKRSLITEVTGETLDTLSGEVYTKTKYAPIQETGGTIKAKDKYLNVPGGPYLNIPLAPNKTARGVMRQDARSVFSTGGYIIKTKTGKYLVMSGGGVPMFVLVKEVTIPARLGMVSAAEDEIPTLLSTLKTELLRGL